tara:strand:- start:1804 stop:2202 length:399 start_codon:yes stop_codon:yes gene_type:complete
MQRQPFRTAFDDSSDDRLREAFFKTEGRNKKILELRFQGLSLKEIGKQFNISRERIRQLIGEMKDGTYMNPKKNPGPILGSTFKKVRERLPQVKKMWAEGMSIKEISESLNRDRSQIQRDLKRLNINVKERI